MLDHITLQVSDIKKSVEFYSALLAPLGWQVGMDFGESVNFKTAEDEGFGQLWLKQSERPLNPTHIAFRAASDEQIRAFHAAGLAAGGSDNGQPGPRRSPGSYAAFVHDPDGNNIEATMHDYAGE